VANFDRLGTQIDPARVVQNRRDSPPATRLGIEVLACLDSGDLDLAARARLGTDDMGIALAMRIFLAGGVDKNIGSELESLLPGLRRLDLPCLAGIAIRNEDRQLTHAVAHAFQRVLLLPLGGVELLIENGMAQW